MAWEGQFGANVEGEQALSSREKKQFKVRGKDKDCCLISSFAPRMEMSQDAINVFGLDVHAKEDGRPEAGQPLYLMLVGRMRHIALIVTYVGRRKMQACLTRLVSNRMIT